MNEEKKWLATEMPFKFNEILQAIPVRIARIQIDCCTIQRNRFGHHISNAIFGSENSATVSNSTLDMH